MDEAKKMPTTLGEAHFRALLQCVRDPIVVWDREYKCVYANRAALDHAGTSSDRVIGKSMREGLVYPHDLVPLWTDRVQQVMETGETMLVEDTTGAGESLACTESVLSPVRDTEGNISAVGVVHREVTERSHQEKLLTIERDLGVALSAGPPLEETLRLCLDAALDASGMDGGAVYLVDEATGDLNLALEKGLSQGPVPIVSHHQADSENARTVREGQPLYASYQQLLDFPEDYYYRNEGLRCLASVPVVHKGKSIGCLNAASRSFEQVPPSVRLALETIASQIGGALVRARVQQDLQESEERYRRFSESAAEGIAIHAGGRLIEVNQALASMVGYEVPELVHNWLDLVAPEYRGYMAHKTASGDEEPYEVLMLRKDGSRFPVEVLGKNLEQRGRLLRVVVLRDLTQRKKAEAELRRSEERYRALVEATAQVVWITDAQGEVVEDIPTWREFTGQTRDETKGWGWLEAIHPEDREKTAQLWEDAIQRGRLYLSEYRARRADGEYRLFAVRGVPIFEEDGTLREWMGTCTDITEHRQADEELRRHRQHLERLVEERSAELERTNQDLQAEIAEHKRIEEALRESEDRFRNIYENAMIGLYRTTPDGRILMANPALVHMLGYSSFDQLGSRNLEESGYEPQYPRSAFRQVIEREGQVLGLESAWKKADGTTLFLRESARAVRDETGNTLYYEGSVEDISARKRAEDHLRAIMADLERSNKELEQFAYVASHDLQEPLRMVSSYTQLLARRYQDQLDQDAHEFISYAVNGAERMQRLIEDLLAYSRVGTRGKAFETTDSQRALDQALANLQTAIEDTGAVVTHDHLPTVIADESQLTQVFQNLVSNALKFHSQAPPRVHVAAAAGDDECVFSISDNGIGIDPEYHERIFVIFQRLNAGDEYPGTGIGLALCKHIVERHGGRIWVESQAGQGSTFYFTIPARKVENHE
jgi:PAS domain S-box-containing protein